MSAPTLNVTESHRSILVRYLSFSRLQRSQQMKTIGTIFEELRSSRLTDDVFTIDEVNEMMDWLQTVLRSEMEAEQMLLVHASALLMNQIFQQAEKSQVTVDVSISQLDDKQLLEEIRSFEKAALETADSAPGPIPPASAAAVRPRSASRAPGISSNVASTESGKTSLEASAEPNSTKMDELEHGQIELVKLRELLKMAEMELETKVNQTTPYKNLKKILQKKNDQLKEFRGRLSKYEAVA